MKEGYIIYRCKICNKTFKLLMTDVDHSIKEGKYLTCPYNGKHSRINVIGIEDKYGQVKQCMDNSVYVREKGRIRQIK